jgi:hypothetical protein
MLNRAGSLPGIMLKKYDSFVKSPELLFFVIPAKAGIQHF